MSQPPRKIVISKGRMAGAGGRKMVAFNALDGDERVGRIELQKTADAAQVKWITVDENLRRSGVATRLYETAADFACDEWGLPLGSDFGGSRAEGSEGFWQKQHRKGRATLIGRAGSGANRFVLSCPAPESLAGLPDVASQIESMGVTLDLYPQGKKQWTLSRIVVPKSLRSKGTGTSALKAIVSEADREGVTVTLTPSTDFGATSKARLVEFYKRFGFVENKGRNKDFSISEAMYRMPKKPLAGLADASGFRPPRGMDLMTHRRAGGCIKVALEGANDSYANGVMCPATAEVDGQKIATMQIEWISVRPELQKKGISTYLTEQMAWKAEAEGRALQSDWLRSAEREEFWKKQQRKGRVAHVVKNARGETSFVLPLPAPESLAALPRSGRIPLATARRALKALGRKATACRITPAALREGMEVEREHRDVTRGGMLKTAKIAASHLCESDRYYKELKKVERKLKRRR